MKPPIENLQTLIALGFPAFPLASGTKRPLTTTGWKPKYEPVDWTGKWAGTLDGDVVSRFLDAQFGVAVGVPVGFIVVDFDVSPKLDAERVSERRQVFTVANEFVSALGVKPFAVTRTSGGGLHLYFGLDGHAPNSAKVYSRRASGLDITIDYRTDGKGYVVVPPSEGYSWLMGSEPGTPEPSTLQAIEEALEASGFARLRSERKQVVKRTEQAHSVPIAALLQTLSIVDWEAGPGRDVAALRFAKILGIDHKTARDAALHAHPNPGAITHIDAGSRHETIVKRITAPLFNVWPEQDLAQSVVDLMLESGMIDAAGWTERDTRDATKPSATWTQGPAPKTLRAQVGSTSEPERFIENLWPARSCNLAVSNDAVLSAHRAWSSVLGTDAIVVGKPASRNAMFADLLVQAMYNALSGFASGFAAASWAKRIDSGQRGIGSELWRCDPEDLVWSEVDNPDVSIREYGELLARQTRVIGWVKKIVDIEVSKLDRESAELWASATYGAVASRIRACSVDIEPWHVARVVVAGHGAFAWSHGGGTRTVQTVTIEQAPCNRETIPDYESAISWLVEYFLARKALPQAGLLPLPDEAYQVPRNGIASAVVARIDRVAPDSIASGIAEPRSHVRRIAFAGSKKHLVATFDPDTEKVSFEIEQTRPEHWVTWRFDESVGELSEQDVYDATGEWDGLDDSPVWDMVKRACQAGLRTDAEHLVATLSRGVFGFGARLQIFVWLYGPGGAGKTTLLNAILAPLAPEHRQATSTDSLLGDQHGLTPDIVRAPVITMDDADAVRQVGFLGRFKQLIAGDKLVLRGLYRAPTSVHVSSLLLVASNLHPERVLRTALDTGILRKMLAINVGYMYDRADGKRALLADLPAREARRTLMVLIHSASNFRLPTISGLMERNTQRFVAEDADPRELILRKLYDFSIEQIQHAISVVKSRSTREVGLERHLAQHGIARVIPSQLRQIANAPDSEFGEGVDVRNFSMRSIKRILRSLLDAELASSGKAGLTVDSIMSALEIRAGEKRARWLVMPVSEGVEVSPVDATIDLSGVPTGQAESEVWQ